MRFLLHRKHSLFIQRLLVPINKPLKFAMMLLQNTEGNTFENALFFNLDLL